MDLEQRASEERKKWEKPYVFRPYPKMLYRGLPGPPGWDHCTVENEDEEQKTLDNGQGWKTTLADAIAHQEKQTADIGVAAAERAAADRKLSTKAQEEAAKADEASDGHHLGEIPETPIKKKPLKRTLSPDDLPPGE